MLGNSLASLKDSVSWEVHDYDVEGSMGAGGDGPFGVHPERKSSLGRWCACVGWLRRLPSVSTQTPAAAASPRLPGLDTSPSLSVPPFVTMHITRYPR